MTTTEAYKELTTVCYGMDRELEKCVLEALERQTPKKPKDIHIVNGGRIGYCPVCDRLVAEDKQYNHEYGNFCDCCGQHISWSDEE